MSKGSTLVQISGGFDSAAAAYHEASNGQANAGCFVDYGQPYRAEELDAARHVAGALGLPLVEVTVTGLYGHSTEIEFKGRNHMLLAVASSVAQQRGLTRIVVGSKSTRLREDDPLSFADSTPKFYGRAEAAIIASGADIVVAQPLRGWTKRMVYRAVDASPIDADRLWNCFYPTNGKPCGACHNCEERKRA